MCGEIGSVEGRQLSQEERRRILTRLHSALAWVGVRIPEEATLGGKRVELRDVVDKIVFDDFLDEQERQEVAWLIDKLEERADFLEERLEESKMTREQAEKLLGCTIGILRALDELKHLDDEEEWEDRRRAVMEEVDDAKRWSEFSKRVYKKDEYY